MLCNNKRIIKNIVGACGALALMATAAQAEQVLDYKIALADDGKTYQVFMKPSVEPFADINLSGQVTIKVPHAADEQAFRITNLTSNVEGADWLESSRVNAPDENPNFDYISFSLLSISSGQLSLFDWQADVEKLMFSFENSAGCVNDVSLMNDDDPFNQLPNSSQTNPANQYTNLGWGHVGKNNYRANYGDAIVCPAE